MTQYRISPSQVNTFLNEPSVWILNKFLGIYGDMGSAAKRGQAVELGLDLIMMNGMDFDTAKDRALAVFDKEMENLYCEKTEKNRDNIPLYLEQAVDCFLNIDDELKQNQIRLEGHIGDIPALGIADYDFSDYLLDLKTTERCPSTNETVSVEHQRQVAYYYLCTGKRQKLAYVTPKKYAIHEITQEQIDKAVKELNAASKAMAAAYSIDENQGIEALTTLYPPRDTNCFYWDTKTLNKAQDIWF